MRTINSILLLISVISGRDLPPLPDFCMCVCYAFERMNTSNLRLKELGFCFVLKKKEEKKVSCTK